jgi:hypothetical protein
MKVYEGSIIIAPLILNLGTRWRRVTRFTPLSPWRKSPRWLLNRRLRRPQGRSEPFGEEKNLKSLFSQPEFRHLIIQPVAYSLYHLRYPCTSSCITRRSDVFSIQVLCFVVCPFSCILLYCPFVTMCMYAFAVLLLTAQLQNRQLNKQQTN